MRTFTSAKSGSMGTDDLRDAVAPFPKSGLPSLGLDDGVGSNAAPLSPLLTRSCVLSMTHEAERGSSASQGQWPTC